MPCALWTLPLLQSWAASCAAGLTGLLGYQPWQPTWLRGQVVAPHVMASLVASLPSMRTRHNGRLSEPECRDVQGPQVADITTRAYVFAFASSLKFQCFNVTSSD
mmetsp:Transcript_38462/g.71602  ORF Transcript_38462/g.71602 Transcript_38462/m.71602 type:complete len:105 (-) Transcript_38462:29-343(-)